jgi:hypothetical protein
VVTLTHDPKLDDPALEAALKSDVFYIGALGSKRTHAKRRERLADRWAGLVDDLGQVGRDDTKSGADFSLAAMLKAAGISHLEAGLVLCAFPHGKANSEEWPNADVRLRHVARCVLHSYEPSAAQADANAEPAELPSGFRMTGNGLFFTPEPTEKNSTHRLCLSPGNSRSSADPQRCRRGLGPVAEACDRDSRAHRWAIPPRLIHRHGNVLQDFGERRLILRQRRERASSTQTVPEHGEDHATPALCEPHRLARWWHGACVRPAGRRSIRAGSSRRDPASRSRQR